MSRRARVVALCAAVSLVPVTAACSGNDAKPKAHDSSASSGLVATRWWSNSAGTTGTEIDANRPQALAGKLRPSASDYCSMLKQTVAAGKSILPGVTAQDPALLASTKAFVAEIQAVAPAAVAASWKVLGDVVVAFVESGGDPTKVKGTDTKAVQSAVGTIAADAKGTCHVNLAAVVH